jgi:hypothetical protein
VGGVAGGWEEEVVVEAEGVVGKLGLAYRRMVIRLRYGVEAVCIGTGHNCRESIKYMR